MNKRSQKKLASLVATAAIVAAMALGQQFGWWNGAKQAAVQTQPGLYTVDHFVDGDTIAVKMNGKVETIRMIGVDTPETHKPNSPVQCYGPAAASFVKNLIGSNQVRLEADEKSTNRDRYNRLLRYVYLPDGRLVEAEAIKNGYGFAYTSFPFTKSAEFEKDQAEARGANKGLWASCNPYQQTNGRWQTENL